MSTVIISAESASLERKFLFSKKETPYQVTMLNFEMKEREDLIDLTPPHPRENKKWY